MIPIELKRACLIKLTKTQNKLYIAMFLAFAPPSIRVIYGKNLSTNNMIDLEYFGPISVNETQLIFMVLIVVTGTCLFFIVCPED